MQVERTEGAPRQTFCTCAMHEIPYKYSIRTRVHLIYNYTKTSAQHSSLQEILDDSVVHGIADVLQQQLDRSPTSQHASRIHSNKAHPAVSQKPQQTLQKNGRSAEGLHHNFTATEASRQLPAELTGTFLSRTAYKSKHPPYPTLPCPAVRMVCSYPASLSHLQRSIEQRNKHGSPMHQGTSRAARHG